VLDPGNADSYVGLKLNFIPHHHPEFVIFDDDGEEVEKFDMAEYGFDGLKELVQEKGFRQKELL